MCTSSACLLCRLATCHTIPMPPHFSPPRRSSQVHTQASPARFFPHVLTFKMQGITATITSYAQSPANDPEGDDFLVDKLDSALVIVRLLDLRNSNLGCRPDMQYSRRSSRSAIISSYKNPKFSNPGPIYCLLLRSPTCQ